MVMDCDINPLLKYKFFIIKYQFLYILIELYKIIEIKTAVYLNKIFNEHGCIEKIDFSIFNAIVKFLNAKISTKMSAHIFNEGLKIYNNKKKNLY